MIFELLRHFLTPAPPEIKAMGYLREAIAIEARYNRCHTSWAGHLARCRMNILAAAKSLPPASRIMIIGSGALHDVPVEDLLSRGHNLILVDIVHLPEIRRRYRNNDRIQFMEQDVTGLVKNLYQKRAVSEIKFSLPQVDLVISLNILSQLPLNLVKYAERQSIALPDDFSGSVMAGHLTLIKTIAPHVLIIGDMARKYEKDGMPVETEPALADLGLPEPTGTWDWHIAPKGELDRDISLTHQVGCWHI